MYIACMVALQIRDVPEDVRAALAVQAAARGQSLQALLLAMVSSEARRSANLAVLARFGDRHDGSHLSVEQAAAALDETRAEREGPTGGETTHTS